MISLKVEKAEYLSDYKIHIYFNDGTNRIVDFKEYLFKHERTYPEYKLPAKFKTFKVEKGELVWGKNWDIIFPVHKLHSGKIISRKQAIQTKPFLSFKVR
ncbi:MAG: DUF2442 domain-containing protein [Bacteroidetes bacterium]|jgi:hypothetical protein|nr:DUF2442 domain-containing protein [Bacteroidota bacterium]